MISISIWVQYKVHKLSLELLIVEYISSPSLRKQTNMYNGNTIKKPKNTQYNTKNNNRNLLYCTTSILFNLKKDQYNELKIFEN